MTEFNTQIDVEINPEGTVTKVIDAFPRQTAPEATPAAAPVAVEITPENVDVPTTSTPAVEVPPVAVPETPVTPPAQPVTPTAPEVKTDTPDYLKKFSESTRRNQIVESQFSELQKVLGDITKQEVPTNEEMVALIPDWEYLDDREKNREIKVIVLERRQNHILNTISNIASESTNASKFEEFITTEPRLVGRENEFYEFTSRPKNAGASMEVLLNAFLFETTPIVAAPVPVPPVVETPPSLERGNPSGGLPPPPTGNPEMSPDELQVLRTTNPRKYMDMIRKGQIK